MTGDLQKTILITGASRGIGLATATLLAGRGFTVYGTSRQPQAETRNSFTLLPLDVRDEQSVNTCVETVISRSGRLDVLINNAGYTLSGAVEEATVADAYRLFETNFFGVMRLTNAVLPHMRRAGRGHIINISSLAGLIGVPYLGLYAASKHALEGYSASLRYELYASNIHISLVEPGDIHTSIASEPPSNLLAAYDGVRERVAAVHAHNLKHGPPPEKVARVILKAIEQPEPRLRYTVAGGDETLLPWARRLLSNGLLEYFIRRAYGLTG
ncbi:MAG: SDR family NAD(P)-dependent oxidoreductase [Chloroflexi bacterium]|nr:SDR family NAD(P)-dependent oxidoreductase [Chloroflexota bacterium]MCC6894983.1 SDR family NAD(P)-dependent oxidoreductase [Anaerolineae bacterium]